LEYSVFIPTPGTYDLELRVARLTEGKSSLHLECDGNDITGLLDVPSTGDWQTWTTIKKTGIYLNTINQTIKIYSDGGDFNINWIKFDVNTSIKNPVGSVKDVSLYPNPANKDLMLELPELTDAIHTTIYSLGGEQIASFDFSHSRICKMDISKFNEGLYFIKYEAGSKQGTIEFMKD